MKLHEYVRFLRRQKGASQQELANAIGTGTRSAISQFELGKTDIPYTKVVLMAHFFETTADELIKRVDDK